MMEAQLLVVESRNAVVELLKSCWLCYYLA